MRYGFWMATLVAVLALFALDVRPAHADWMRAESDRFIVYSEGSERDLRAYVEKLETFDRLLRLKMGLPVDEAPLRKLPIYLVDDSGLRRIRPGIGDGIAGFYAAREEDIFAVALRDGMGDDVLLHEYAHHFMLQNFAYGYPAWFVEGFAEYYMTADIRTDRIRVGMYNENRGSWLRGATWISMRDLLFKRAGEVRRRNATYYPVAWLLAHWFMGDPGRFEMLTRYLSAVGAGHDSVAAMQEATGMSLDQLRRELRGYMGRIPYYELQNPFPTAHVTITRLSPAADDFLLMSLRLTGVPTDRKEQTLGEVRRMAQRHPDAPEALVALGHAEIHIGDRNTGEAVLRRLLDAHPDNLAGLQFMATSLLERAEEEGADVRALKREAMGYLARAHALDDADYRTFMLLAKFREGEAGYPNENDIVTRELALQLAPQLDLARLMMAEAYLAAGRQADAIRTIEPLANDPHGGEMATRAQALLDRARGLTEAEALAEQAAADAVTEEPARGNGP